MFRRSYLQMQMPPGHAHPAEYDEQSALQAALEASTQEQLLRDSRTSWGDSKSTAEDERLARELQQAEVSGLASPQGHTNGKRAAASSATDAPPPGVPSDHTAKGHSPASSSASMGRSSAPPRPSSNPFAPSRRMPWDRVQDQAAATPGSSAAGSDPLAALPPLYPELAGTPARGTSHSGLPSQHAADRPVQHPPLPPIMDTLSTASDQALARALQEQLDLEPDQASGQTGRPDSHTGPNGTAGSSAARRLPGANSISDEAYAKQLQQEMDRQAATSTPNQASAAVGPRQPAARSSYTGPNQCGGCGKPVRMDLFSVFGENRCIVATGGGQRWHAACLVCGHCRRSLADEGAWVIKPETGTPYHAACFKETFHGRCSVCRSFLPETADGRVEFSFHPFFKEDRFCAAHTADGTPKCTACSRHCPRAEQWAELGDGRSICLSCITSVVVDTADAQPLYSKVLAFYESLGMRLPARPPLMLVDGPALNEAEGAEGRSSSASLGSSRTGRGGGGAPMFHTRGLTLSQEYSQIRTVVRARASARSGAPFWATRPELVRVPVATHCEVTAVLVLHGMPWLLTGSVLAHELMHAWLRLSGVHRLSLDVEEGLCQLMAMLWLESQPPALEGTWEERLTSFFAYQIRTDPSHVYGDGFRAAFEAFQKHGLPAVVASVRATGSFPLG